ncbi:MAG: DUF3037 domain-containing protein [Terriglobales bacterium]
MAESPLQACQYVLIRLAPNPIRNEAITIGVALYEPRAGGFTGLRLRPNLDAARALSPRFDPAILSGLEQDLLSRLSTEQPAWLSRKYFLEQARETFSHTLRLSEPRAVLTADPAAALDRLYQQYAAPLSAVEEKAGEVRGARRRVLAHLRQVFAEESVLRHLRRNARAGEWLGTDDSFRFDFAYQKQGETRQQWVIQALPWATGEGAVKELCFTIERVRRHLGGLDVAAFHDDSPGGGAAYMATLMSEAGVRMLPLTEAPAEAARIRLALGLQ